MITQELLAILQCPRCHDGHLTQDGRGEEGADLTCSICSSHYPIRSGLPILLPDAAWTGPEPPKSRSGAVVETGGPSWLPRRLNRAVNVLRNQGPRPFLEKASRAYRTGLERLLPILRDGPTYVCPFCGVSARFLTYRGRPRAQCPDCGAKERDRLMVLALKEVLAHCDRPLHVLHVAPESTIRRFLSPFARHYVGTDLTRGMSSYSGQLSAATDLTRLAFRSDTFDLVVASHVLEHIPDDRTAVEEVLRVLKPGGVAVLPVPVVHDGPTVEYDRPNPLEEMHVRAPGRDYFDRFSEIGFEVVLRRSSDYPPDHQSLSYHARREAVTKDLVSSPSSSCGSGSEQYLPLCFKGSAWQNLTPPSVISTDLAK